MSRKGSTLMGAALLAGAVTITPLASADTAIEIANLNRLATELETVRAYADTLALTPEQQRAQQLRFRYDELSALLELLESEVRRHVDELHEIGDTGS